VSDDLAKGAQLTSSQGGRGKAIALDAVVVGSGPNGLAAAVTLARAGLSVEVFEGERTPGGGCRTEPLTLPGFQHDVCSSVHPLLLASPFFQTVDWAGLGVTLRSPRVAFAHPLDGGRAASVVASVEDTADGLGPDRAAYRRLFGPLTAAADAVTAAALSPVRSIPARPLAVARFGALGVLPAKILARRFATDEAQALLAGVAAHSMLPLGAPLSGAFALLLTTLAHSVGWPVVEGGSARIVDALVGELEAAGGRVRTDQWISSLDDLPPARATLFDVTPRQLIAIAGARLPNRARRALGRFGYGPGVCKVDWALAEPVPWTASVCRDTVTVHVAGTLADVVLSESEVASGRHPQRPYCIVVQPGVVDPTRAPPGRQTLWGYCHVPSGSTTDMAERIEAQIERFAPGFRDLILGRVVATAADTERHNPNYIGGDINGGLATLGQTIGRPTLRWNPYRTGLDGVYLCSASTPPGGGVHGMCGYWAARTVIRDLARSPAA
jgi:phytoene dehydrogenase-like protein